MANITYARSSKTWTIKTNDFGYVLVRRALTKYAQNCDELSAIERLGLDQLVEHVTKAEQDMLVHDRVYSTGLSGATSPYRKIHYRT